MGDGIKAIPFKPGHLDLITFKEIFSGDKGVIDRLEHLHQAPQTIQHTLVMDHRVLAVFGGCVLWPKVMEVWSVTSPAVRLQPLAFHKETLSLMNIYWDELKLNRMQMSVRAGFIEAQRWSESLGFRAEGLMKQFGPDGDDYFLMARLR
jgi:hypothetical protein